MVCLDCQRCRGKAPLQKNETSFELNKSQADRFVARIEKLRIEQVTFNNLNLENLSYLEYLLLQVWVEKEIEMERLHKAKISALFEVLIRKGL